MEEALAAARAGEGQLLLLEGSAGMGKTRLAVELQRRAQDRRILVLSGSCSHSDVSLPYLPFLEAIGNHLSVADLGALRADLGTSAAELANQFPQLGVRTSRQEGDPNAAKLRLFEAIFALLRYLGRQQMVLLTVEDIHWADSASQELLDYVSRRLSVLPVMLLATYRGEEVDRRHRLAPILEGWRRSGKVQFIGLEPLTGDEVAQMVQAIFNVEGVRDDLRDLLRERSEGNPFVLEEILKAALDQGDIFRNETGWSRRNLANLSIPATVKDMILLRLERLPAGSREVLRLAALLGETFDAHIVSEVSRRREEIVGGVLHAAVRHQLLEDDLGTPWRYHFRHALTREAIIEDMAALERRRLHARIAAVLEGIPTTSMAELANHLLAADAGDRAIPACLAAAADAERRRGYRQAADIYQRVLHYLPDNLEHARTLCRLGRALALEGDPASAVTPLVEGTHLLEAWQHGAEAAAYRLLLGGCYWELSRFEPARMEYEQARDTLEPLGPSDKLADAYVRLSHLSQGAYHWSDGIRFAERAIAIAEAVASDGARIAAYTFLGHCLADLGQVDQGLAYLRQSYEQASERQLDWVAVTALAHTCQVMCKHFRARDVPPVIAQLRELRGGEREASLACFFEGRHYYYLGQLQEARAALESGLALAREARVRTVARWNQLGLALVLITMGEARAGGRFLDAGTVTVEQQELAELMMWRIRFALDLGRTEDAERMSRQAAGFIDWKRRLGVDEVGLIDSALEATAVAGTEQAVQQLQARLDIADFDKHSPYALRLQGRLHLAGQDPIAARESLDAAARSFHEAGYRPEEWRTRRTLAEALLLLGDGRAARSELRSVASEAQAAGAAVEAGSARRRLAALSTQRLPTADEVRIALERLDNLAGLGETPLAQLPAIRGEGEEAGRSLRALLIESMHELASSQSRKRAQAGRLLVDYYVSQVGSHELVAERLHLSRATFYRRLRLGWELLAERLASSSMGLGGPAGGTAFDTEADAVLAHAGRADRMRRP